MARSLASVIFSVGDGSLGVGGRHRRGRYGVGSQVDCSVVAQGGKWIRLHRLADLVPCMQEQAMDMHTGIR